MDYRTSWRAAYEWPQRKYGEVHQEINRSCDRRKCPQFLRVAIGFLRDRECYQHTPNRSCSELRPRLSCTHHTQWFIVGKIHQRSTIRSIWNEGLHHQALSFRSEFSGRLVETMVWVSFAFIGHELQVDSCTTQCPNQWHLFDSVQRPSCQISAQTSYTGIPWRG